MQYIWIGIIVLLIILEFITLSVTPLFFVVSGIVTWIVSSHITNFFIQLLIFFTLGFILMYFFKPFLDRKIKYKYRKHKLIGINGIVTSKISKNKIGEVKVYGKRWKATSNIKLEVGQIIIVKELNNKVVTVEKN